MAKVKSSPSIPSDIPGSGQTLLGDITADTIWKDGVIQYYYGDNTAASLDTQFSSDYSSYFGSTPIDAVYVYGDLTKRGFEMIDSVITTDFKKTTDIAAADEVLVTVTNDNSSGLEGFSTFPGTNDHNGQTDEYWSFTVYNLDDHNMAAAPEVGGGEYANWTILHEIGHSLGLYHTHQETSGLPPLESVGEAMDNERYSVMSYNSATSGQNKYGHAVTMMALDIAALQALYGSEKYANTKSTYTLLDAETGELDLTQGSVEIGRAYYCVWDSGGSDTMRYGGSENSVMLNLNAATLDTSGVAGNVAAVLAELATTAFYQKLTSTLQTEISDEWHHAGGFFSRVLVDGGTSYSALDGGFTIANGVVIENAAGGGLADLLIGNGAANKLSGLAGDDTMLGSGGIDTLLGAGGNDQLMGGSGNDKLRGGIGGDTLSGGGGNDSFIYIAKTESGLDTIDRDVITDFLGKDVIDVSAFDTSSKKGDQAFKFIGTQEFHDKRGELRYVVLDDRVTVEVDINGNGEADLIIDVLAVTSLNKADFHL